MANLSFLARPGRNTHGRHRWLGWTSCGTCLFLFYSFIPFPVSCFLCDETQNDLLSFQRNRIPTPEGFAPLAPGMLNDQLDFLIQKYTLQGQNMLVHCRGGVGRAGLVACCWMLKMGLCGWVQEPQLHGNAATNGMDPPQPLSVKPVKTPGEVSFQSIVNGQTPSPPPAPAPAPISRDHHSDLPHPATVDDNLRPLTPPDTPLLSASSEAPAPAPAPSPIPSPTPTPTLPIQWNTVDLVERVVRVVRWRRSVKAIETYEQVRFLVEFVEFLRGGCVPTPEVEVGAVDPNPNPKSQPQS